MSGLCPTAKIQKVETGQFKARGKNSTPVALWVWFNYSRLENPRWSYFCWLVHSKISEFFCWFNLRNPHSCWRFLCTLASQIMLYEKHILKNSTKKKVKNPDIIWFWWPWWPWWPWWHKTLFASSQEPRQELSAILPAHWAPVRTRSHLKRPVAGT